MEQRKEADPDIPPAKTKRKVVAVLSVPCTEPYGQIDLRAFDRAG
jgi:hypothetical protein